MADGRRALRGLEFPRFGAVAIHRVPTDLHSRSAAASSTRCCRGGLEPVVSADDAIGGLCRFECQYPHSTAAAADAAAAAAAAVAATVVIAEKQQKLNVYWIIVSCRIRRHYPVVAATTAAAANSLITFN